MDRFSESTDAILPLTGEPALDPMGGSMPIARYLRRSADEKAPTELSYLGSSELPERDFLPSVEEELLHSLLKSLDSIKVTIDYEHYSAVARAAGEALSLIESGLFNETAFPKIRVDEYGEFCFIISRESAYVDIGVSGNGELSYHVKNNETGRSTYDDVKEYDGDIPSELKLAISEI